MLRNVSLTIGFCAIAVQVAFGVNTMLSLSESMPIFITSAFIAVVFIVELMKPLTTFFISQSSNYWARFGAVVFLISLSCLSIYATHFTMRLTASNQISEADKATLHNLDLQQEAYLEAVKGGVVSATKVELASIDDKRDKLLKSAYSAPANWAIIISAMIEIIILAAFAMAAFFSKSVNQKDNKKGILIAEEIPKAIEAIPEEITNENKYIKLSENPDVKMPQITKLMKDCSIKHAKAKQIIQYFNDFQKERNSIDVV